MPARPRLRRIAAAVAVGAAAVAGPALGSQTGDPALKSGFGTHGIVVRDIDRRPLKVQDVAVDSVGRTVIVGTRITARERRRLVVHRFTARGRLDRDFGGDGSVRLPFQAYPRTPQLATTPANEIVVACQTGDYDSGVIGAARLTAKGRLDQSFDSDGAQTFTPPDALDLYEIYVEGVDVVPGGAVRIAGSASQRQGGYGFSVTALRADGDLDPDYGDGGFAYRSIDDLGFGYARASARATDGGVVVAGVAEAFETSARAAAVRFDATGRPDPDFGERGLVTVPTPSVASAVALGEDGAVSLVGPAYGDFAVARLTEGGDPDTRFSTDGVGAFDFSDGEDRPIDAVTRGGALLVAGRVPSLKRRLDFGFVSIRPDGRLERRFANDGRLTVDGGRRVEDFLRGVALAPSGIVAAGSSKRERGDVMLVRLRGGA